MRSKNTSLINSNKIKKLYIDGCRARSIKPRKNGLNDFIALLENDINYWMNANLKFFLEKMNH